MNQTKAFKFLLLFLALPVAAQTVHHSKKQQPVYFVSDTVTFNNSTHTVTYIGHVKVRQGHTHITGDKMVLHLSKTNKIIKMVDTGRPATYTAPMTNHPGMIHAEADTITNDALHNRILLDGHARVAQNHNTIRAAHISYDRTRGVLHTHGGVGHQLTHITVMPTH